MPQTVASQLLFHHTSSRISRAWCVARDGPCFASLVVASAGAFAASAVVAVIATADSEAAAGDVVTAAGAVGAA